MRTSGCYSICEEPMEVVEEEQTLRLQLLKGSGNSLTFAVIYICSEHIYQGNPTK